MYDPSALTEFVLIVAAAGDKIQAKMTTEGVKMMAGAEQVGMWNELFASISWKLIVPVAVLQLVLVVTALVSCVRAEETNGPKWLWVIIILFINLLGPIIYFVFGRRTR